MTTAGAYGAAVEFIRQSDLLRVFDRAGLTPSLARIEHHNQARARLDEELPSLENWQSWSARRRRAAALAAHELTMRPVQKMDTPVGLFRAYCSCGYESSGVQSNTDAFKSWSQHVKAKTS